MRRSTLATVVLAASLALFAQSIAGAGDPVISPPAAGPMKSDTGKRICREVTPTGTRFMKRVCRTPDEWQHDTDAAQRHMEESDMSRREFQPDCGVGCTPH